jgi:PPE-repeat protein
MTYYKVISKDNKSCHGGDFDWTPYLPKGSKPGKWTPEIKDTEECTKGYHVTKYWNMWYKEEGCRIFECEVKGRTYGERPGVIEKEVCSSIRLVKEIFPVFDKNRNTGDYNTGNWNTGNWNTGHRNTGDLNTGDLNTGDLNTGNWNTGHRNTGDLNTGDLNTGDLNTGNSNTGNSNIGYGNTGDCNTGNCNTGNRNTGNWNTGDWNTGDWNKGNRNTGFFNTIDSDIQVFNKPCKQEDWENANKPGFIYFNLNGTYEESWRKAYDSASDEEKLLLVKLPNFNAKVFQEISGIMVDEKTGQEIK